MTRRTSILAIGSFLLAGCTRSERPPVSPAARSSDPLAELEASVGGRVGVFAVDTATGRTLARREDERFAMCSTFKWVLAAAVLARVDRGELALADRVPYGSADLLEYAPVAAEHVAEGALSVEALARAAVTVSDNTAANLLLGRVGGPEGLTAFARTCGDPVTRLDRAEPTLNMSDPADVRDTTSPRAMVGLMRAVLVGDALSAASRERLVALLRACETGRRRLRAGLPASWAVGDKTGTGERGAVNDVAIAVPPGRAPVLVAAYLSDGAAAQEQLEAAHATIGALVGRRLALFQGPMLDSRALHSSGWRMRSVPPSTISLTRSA